MKIVSVKCHIKKRKDKSQNINIYQGLFQKSLKYNSLNDFIIFFPRTEDDLCVFLCVCVCLRLLSDLVPGFG